MEEFWEDILKGLKEGSVSLEKIRSKLEDRRKELYNELMKKREQILEEIEEELMEKIRDGRIGEALGSIEETIGFLREITLSKPKSNITWEDVEEYYKELEEIRKKSFVWNKAAQIEKSAEKVLNALKQYWTFIKNETTYKAKLETREALIKFLEAKRREVETLLKEIQITLRKELNPPEGAHIAPPDIDDLIVPDFKPNSMRLAEIKKEWLELVSDRIREKVKKSFRPDLSVFRFDNVPEGWHVPEGRVATPKERLILAVLPEFVEVRGREYIQRVVEKNSGLDATVYKFVFGISLEEVMVE